MKTKSKCIGCQGIRLVNALGLCKRCNRHAHDFISTDEMARIKLEREAMLTAAHDRKEKKEADAKAKEEAGEEGEEGEGEAEGEGEEAEATEEDAGKDEGAEGGN
jgi:hypothetical protein